MGVFNDDAVQIHRPERAGEPGVVTVSCPDKTGLGCDLCRVILSFGLSVIKGDANTDGLWCYIVLWVVAKGGRAPKWSLLQRRLIEMCPVPSPLAGVEISSYLEAGSTSSEPQVFLLKFSCYDRLGLLHDVTRVLCELELGIAKVKVSTTPDGQVLDLFFLTDARGFLQTESGKADTCEKLAFVLGASMTSCVIELPGTEMSTFLQAPASLPQSIADQLFGSEDGRPSVPSGLPAAPRCEPTVTMDNSLSPSQTLFQIKCADHKGLLYDIMRTLKDYNIQTAHGRFYSSHAGKCEIDLLVVQKDGKKIVDPHKQTSLCARLKAELSCPLRAVVVSRGADTQLLVANPVELSGNGRPMVFHDVTLALKNLHVRIFQAEIRRHVVGGREWELYRMHLGEEHELTVSAGRIVEAVTKMLMGWD